MSDFFMEIPTNKIYARPNENGIVIKLFSSVFEDPQENDILVEEGNEEYHAHVHLKYSLYTEDEPVVYQYKIVKGRMLKRTDNEIAKSREDLLPSISKLQNEKQEENKKALAKFLDEHPLTWTDGKTYGVSLDDQSELNLNLAQYQLAKAAGLSAKLEWHSQKEACREFEETTFIALALAITNYVYPYLRHQESIKSAIYACETREEIANIIIDYESINS